MTEQRQIQAISRSRKASVNYTKFGNQLFSVQIGAPNTPVVEVIGEVWHISKLEEAKKEALKIGGKIYFII